MAVDLKLLNPIVKKNVEELIKNANARLTGDFQMVITQGFRSIAEQDALYHQGRFGDKRPKVTNAQGGTSYHNYGLAVDFALKSKDGKKVLWDVKLDSDHDHKSDWMEIVEEAKKLGFEWGGDWKGFTDMPHLQMTFGLSIDQLKHGAKAPTKLPSPKS